MTIAEMRAKAAELYRKAQSIQAAAEADGVDLTAEQEAEILALLDERKGLIAQADRKQRLQEELDAAAVDETTIIRRAPPSMPDSDPATDPEAELRRAPATARDPEVERRHGFRDLGEFAMAAYRANPSVSTALGLSGIDNRLNFFADTAATGMSVAVGADGGFLVPPEFSQGIWDEMNTGGANLLDLVDLHVVGGSSVTFAANAETSRATGSRYGGIRGYWLREAAQITSSKPTLRQLTLEPEELAVLVYVTNKLLNSPASSTLTTYLRRAAADEINFLVGDAIVNGNGVSKPLGILNSGCAVSVAKVASQTADTVVQQNVQDAWGRLHARSRSRAVWLMNQDVQPHLNRIELIKNVAGSENVGGVQPSVYDAANHTLMGRPIIDCEYAQTVGDVGDLILWDPTGYAAGVRSNGIDSAMSIHLRFDYAESVFRFMFAVDGQTWLASALTPFNGANTLSHVVTIAARA